MSRIPSPARSEGHVIARRSKVRRTMSVTSARSDGSVRLTSIVEQAIQSEELKWSPMRRSVLPDDTNIDMPRRASWWKRVEGSSRDVLEALDTNKMEVNLLLEDFEIEVQKKTHELSVQESSDNESVASIVVPPRRLFNQKKQPQGNFGDNMGSRISLGRTNLEDHENTINVMPKNLFKLGQPMNRPVFPAALLNSTNKTVNQTVEPETDKQARKLFGQAGTKRKNMFTDFVLSESEDDSEVQYQVFGFKKNDNKRRSLASRSRRMPSLTPSVTTDIDIDDWNLLPSSTMIGNGSGATEVSEIITDKDIEQAQDENADVTLTDANETLKPESDTNNKSKTKEKQSHNRTRLSRKQSDEFEKTVNHEVIDIVQASKKHGVDEIVKLDDVSNKTLRSQVCVDNTVEMESSNRAEIIQFKQDSKITQCNTPEISKSGHINVSKNEKVLESSKQPNNEHEVINESDILDKAPNNGNISEQTTVNEPSVEEKMAELYGQCGDIENSTRKSDPSIEQESQISNKETSNEDQDEDMEEMVWNENDEDKVSDTTEEIEDDQNGKDNKRDVDDQNEENDEQDLSEHTTTMKDVPDKSQKNVESSVEGENIEQENDVVDETPNTTYDTTGRKRKNNDAQVKSPEAILTNMSKENMSFKPVGRSTSFRKSKSPTDDVNARRTLIPIQESIVDSDGSRNSSSEGSGWDSHRTTRKTLRQTFGKDFTPRKSLRALVMAKSAKRQTDGGRDTSKINKMINKQNKTALEDQHVRDRHVSIRNLSSEQLSNPKSPGPEISAHHVSDPHIAEPQISYHKSVHEVLNDSGPEISMNASYGTGMSRESLDNASKDHFITSKQKSTVKKDYVRVETDCEMQEELDYDPSVQEDSIREASSRNMSKHKNSAKVKQVLETQSTSKQRNSDQELSGHDASKQEIEVSESEESEQEQESQKSTQEIEDQEFEQEDEHEQSQQEIEAESEQEDEHEQSQQEIEAESEQEDEHEQSQRELEAESEQEDEHEQTQQEIEAESEQDVHEQSQQEIEAESEQEDEHEQSQQEIEAESEQEEDHEHEEIEQEIVIDSDAEQDHEDSEQEIEAESEQEQSLEHNESQETVNVSDHESDRESGHIYDGPDGEIDSDHEQDDQEVSQSKMSKRFTERVVFDNEMSDQEIDYELSERASRQITDIEISEQVSDDETEGVVSRVSEQAKHHDVSIGTQQSTLIMQMDKIVQQNKEIRRKCREEVQNSLQQQRLAYNHNEMSLMQSKYSIRRLKKFEPTKPKRKPKKITPFAIKGLPKEFLEDLKYKPPKRFQPANAPWITKRLYRYLETKLEPKYDYRARVRAEQLVQNVYEFTKQVRRRDLAPQSAVDELKKEMARLKIVRTHFEFYEFIRDFMPREIRIKVNPDIVNKIPLPRDIFGDILQSQPIVD